MTRAKLGPWVMLVVVSAGGCGSSGAKPIGTGIDGGADADAMGKSAAGAGAAGAGTAGAGAAGAGTTGTGVAGTGAAGVGTAGAGGSSAGASGSAGSGGAGGMTMGVAHACAGVAAIPADEHACRTSAECPPNFGNCQETYFTNACPACAAASCETDVDCGAGKTCVAIPNRKCPCPASKVCVAKCSGTACSPGDICDAQGKCAAQKCTDGYACRADLICAPTRLYGDPHGCNSPTCDGDGFKCPDGLGCMASANGGVCTPVTCVGGAFKCPLNTVCTPNATEAHQCVRRACTSDAGCDCGACVAGRCQDRLFVCSQTPTP